MLGSSRRSGTPSLPTASSLKLGSALLLPAAPALSALPAGWLALSVFSSGGPTCSLPPLSAALVCSPLDCEPGSEALAGEAGDGWLGLLVLVLPGVLLELLEGGGVLPGGGVGGVWGWVGLLAVGQPDRIRQRPSVPAMLHQRPSEALLNIERFNKFFRLYGLSRLETRPEGGPAQLPHQARGLSVLRLIIIHSLHVLHPAIVAHTEG